jgi:hypothetical protein
MIGRKKDHFCQICGTKTLPISVVFEGVPYSAKTGKLDTQTVDGCPNEGCKAFYKTADYKEAFGNFGPLPGNWIWAGRVPPR